MHFRKIIIAFFFCTPVIAMAQENDITGLWKGTLYNDSTQKYYKYEIGISREKGKYTGFSHTWFLIGDTQYFGVKKVTVKIAGDGKIVVEDNGLIAHNYPIPPNKGVRQLNILTFDGIDSLMTLSGPFTTNRTKEYHSLTGHISLQRKNDFWQSSLVPHLQELGRDEELSFVKEEKQLLAKKDADEIKQQLAERRLSAEKKKEALDGKEKNIKAIAKQETLKEQEAKKIAEEKARAEKALAEQEVARQTAADKEIAKQTAIKERQEKAAALEKEKKEKLLAKQEADKQIAAEKERAKLTAIKEQQEKTSKSSPTFKTNTEPAAEVAVRKTVVQQTVSFSSDSLQLSLYDNGEIDGDTVSVLMNGQLVLAKQGLGIKAIKHTIHIPRNTDRIEMVMYAESLGTIPPNTGLLVIRDGKDLYEIRFSGDLQKNAAIVFNRKKE